MILCRPKAKKHPSVSAKLKPPLHYFSYIREQTKVDPSHSKEYPKDLAMMHEAHSCERRCHVTDFSIKKESFSAQRQV